MLLKGKTTVIYGVGDSLGGAVAKAFAAAGARVFLTARRREKAEKVAREIAQAGGQAEVDAVDALVAREVDEHAARVVASAGTLDISFNLINIKDRQNTPLVEMEAADFVRPVETAMLTQFLTCTAAGRIMAKQRSGVILSLTATPGGIGYSRVGGFGPACCAIEAFSTNLAAELGPRGVRVVNLRSAGSPDSRPFREAVDRGGEKAKQFLEKIEADTMLKKLPMMSDIANAAVFLASDLAGKITGVTLDVTAGTTSALNYKEPSIAFIEK
ncbi:MAG TPA: SDR family oxidoreductase [Polyangiaceae bacterium]|nr:SDR family oxidoreductase [Polyangiaceae bacterium]